MEHSTLHCCLSGDIGFDTHRVSLAHVAATSVMFHPKSIGVGMSLATAMQNVYSTWTVEAATAFTLFTLLVVSF